MSDYSEPKTTALAPPQFTEIQNRLSSMESKFAGVVDKYDATVTKYAAKVDEVIELRARVKALTLALEEIAGLVDGEYPAIAPTIARKALQAQQDTHAKK